MPVVSQVRCDFRDPTLSSTYMGTCSTQCHRPQTPTGARPQICALSGVLSVHRLFLSWPPKVDHGGEMMMWQPSLSMQILGQVTATFRFTEVGPLGANVAPDQLLQPPFSPSYQTRRSSWPGQWTAMSPEHTDSMIMPIRETNSNFLCASIQGNVCK